jgi:hypothetical protein
MIAAQLFTGAGKPPFVAPGLKPLLQRTSWVRRAACTSDAWMRRKRRAALPQPREGGLRLSERTLGRQLGAVAVAKVPPLRTSHVLHSWTRVAIPLLVRLCATRGRCYNRFCAWTCRP